MQTNKNKMTLNIVYGGAVIVFFAVTAFLLGGLNTNFRNTNSELETLDDILSGSTDTSVDVADQYFPLAITNEVTEYQQIATNVYRVSYEYNVKNEYDFDVELQNAVSYFLQQDTLARVNKINVFSSEGMDLNERFNAVNVNELFAQPTRIAAGKSYKIKLQLDFVFAEDAAPIRNVIEMTGTRAQTPTSYATSSSATPNSYPGQAPNLFSGSAVSLFYPGIELENLEGN